MKCHFQVFAYFQAPGFENWNYTVENVDGALQVAIKIYEIGDLVM